MKPLSPASFLSSESTARIEPDAFIAHVLSYRGLTPHDLGLRPTALLAFIPELERRLLRELGSPQPHPQLVQRQRLYNPEAYAFSALASPMGAPMAVMLLEQLIALGARRFLYLGFCGALDPSYRIGDCVIPTQGWREEGTSYHYLPPHILPTTAERLNAVLVERATAHGLSIRRGAIWTTDAPYRETAEKIQYFQRAGVQIVDMEMAALLAVAHYRGCEVTGLLIVSDECYHPTWNPGFGHPHLRRACRTAVRVAIEAGQRIAPLE
jgi:uridine phosphorylase